MILHGWEAVFFWVFSIAAIFAGLLTVMARNAVHSALFLISSLLSVAALFILLGAEFIAGVQILVYVGGVMVLFLFVIMLVNVGAEEEGKDEIFNKPRQVATSLVFCLLLVGSLLWAVSNGSKVLMAKTLNPDGTPIRESVQDPTLRASATGTSVITTATQSVGAALYRYGSLPFEIASVLLLVAI